MTYSCCNYGLRCLAPLIVQELIKSISTRIRESNNVEKTLFFMIAFSMYGSYNTRITFNEINTKKERFFTRLQYNLTEV